MDVRVEAMTGEDWAAVRVIYQEGIDAGHATFETEVAGMRPKKTTDAKVASVARSSTAATRSTTSRCSHPTSRAASGRRS
jgi:L-amino acid N-acyltransferase YncA